MDSKVEGDEEMEDEDDDSYAEFEDAEYWKKKVTPNTNRKHQEPKLIGICNLLWDFREVLFREVLLHIYQQIALIYLVLERLYFLIPGGL